MKVSFPSKIRILTITTYNILIDNNYFALLLMHLGSKGCYICRN